MKRTLIALLTASVAASASAIADNQKALQAKADSANAKRGVEIGGSIRAVAQRSSFKTDQDPLGLNQMPDVERNEFVSADLSFGFRPFENVRANIIMRLGGGMQGPSILPGTIDEKSLHTGAATWHESLM